MALKPKVKKKWIGLLYLSRIDDFLTFLLGFVYH